MNRIYIFIPFPPKCQYYRHFYHDHFHHRTFHSFSSPKPRTSHPQIRCSENRGRWRDGQGDAETSRSQSCQNGLHQRGGESGEIFGNGGRCRQGQKEAGGREVSWGKVSAIDWQPGGRGSVSKFFSSVIALVRWI